jgi:diamine N-acetyltransferase
MKSAVTITAASAAQIPLVQRLARNIWWQHYPPILSAAQIEYMLDRGYADDALRRFVDEPGAGLAIAREEDDAVGFAAWYRPEMSAMKLDKLYVLPRCHRAGIGRSLIEHVAAQARSLACACITLNVNRQNASAIGAYERCGFSIESRGDFPIGNGFVMEDYIMVRAL